MIHRFTDPHSKDLKQQHRNVIQTGEMSSDGNEEKVVKTERIALLEVVRIATSTTDK